MLLGESTFAPGRLQMTIMDGQAMLVECPAFLGHGAVRCGLPAEEEERYTLGSTDGPLPSARIRCPRGHWFNGPIEALSATESRRTWSSSRADGRELSRTGPSYER